MSLIFYKIDLLDSALERHKTFDVFIQSTSAEERSYHANKILRKKDTEVNQNILFCFKEVISSIEPSRHKSFLANYDLGSCQTARFDCELLNVENGMKCFYEQFLSNQVLTANKKILIDISTFVKPYFFCLLKLLGHECRASEIYITYTEPISYSRPVGDRFTFTRGLDHVGEIPSFNGFTDIEKRNLLVILLGFEGQRALEILRGVQPDKTLVINGFPAYRSEFKDVSLVSNISVIREGECLHELQFSSASDPFETYRTIEKLYENWSKTYNFSLAPLGTKPMALGACLFALLNPDTRVLYAYPQGYVQKVAQGYGRTWMYEIFLE